MNMHAFSRYLPTRTASLVIAIFVLGVMPNIESTPVRLTTLIAVQVNRGDAGTLSISGVWDTLS
jgi:hypothetical protein